MPVNFHEGERFPLTVLMLVTQIRPVNLQKAVWLGSVNCALYITTPLTVDTILPHLYVIFKHTNNFLGKLPKIPLSSKI